MTADARLDPRIARSRAAALAATADLIAERGIASTTIEAVAARCGVAKTTIYRQWPNQHAMVLAAFDALLQTPTDPDTGTLVGDLQELADGLAAALTHSPAARLMPALIDAAERDVAFAELHAHEAERRHQVIIDAVKRGQARDEIPADLDPGELLEMISGPLFYRRYITGGPLDCQFVDGVVTRALIAAGAGQPTR